VSRKAANTFTFRPFRPIDLLIFWSQVLNQDQCSTDLPTDAADIAWDRSQNPRWSDFGLSFHNCVQNTPATMLGDNADGEEM